jgi:hypothetical protein
MSNRYFVEGYITEHYIIDGYFAYEPPSEESDRSERQRRGSQYRAGALVKYFGKTLKR